MTTLTATPAALRRARLHVVPPPAHETLPLIGRPRLLEQLRGTPLGSVTLVIAPAGYGKSTLLTEWSNADPRPCAWAHVTRRDDEPARLARLVAERLRSA